MLLKRFALAGGIAVIIAAACLPSFAQTSFGRINGTVTDASGGAVGAAKVTITNAETQIARTVETDNNGFYVITNLPIGPYSAVVAHPGFQRTEQKGLDVVADGRLTADFQLKVGDLGQSVEVVAATADTLNTVSGELSRVIEAKQVDNLALNGGNYVELLTLVPGAVVTSPDQFSRNHQSFGDEPEPSTAIAAIPRTSPWMARSIWWPAAMEA